MFASQLSNHLLNIGHEVKVVSIFPGEIVLPFERPVTKLNRPPKKRLYDFVGWKQLAKLIDEFRPDIVQANAGDTLKFTVLSKVIFKWNTPIVFRNASMVSSYVRSSLVYYFNSWLYGQVQFVVSVSEQSRKDLIRLYPSLVNRIEVIPIGIEPVDVQRLITPEKFIVHVGGFTFEKNHVGLIRIMKEVSVTNKEIELWLVGEGPGLDSVKNLVVESGLNKRVRFLGYRDDVQSIIKAAEMLVLPSIIEGLPAVILEAQYCKTPVIAYDVGGVSEIIEQGKSGWLVKRDDETGFVEQILQLLNGKEEISEVTEAAHKQVVSKFNNAAIASRFNDVYNRLANQVKC